MMIDPHEGCPECGAVPNDLDELERERDEARRQRDRLLAAYRDQRAMDDESMDEWIESWEG